MPISSAERPFGTLPHMQDAHPTPSLGLRMDDQPHAVVVVAEGELDLATSPAFLRVLSGAPSDDRPVVIDAKGLHFVDSSGLRALLEAQGTVSQHGRRFVIAQPSTELSRLLDLVDLRSRFDVADGTGPESLS